MRHLVTSLCAAGALLASAACSDTLVPAPLDRAQTREDTGEGEGEGAGEGEGEGVPDGGPSDDGGPTDDLPGCDTDPDVLPALSVPPGDGSAFAAIIETVRASVITEQQLPGAAIALVQDGELVYAGGIGVRATGGTEPVTASTTFSIASVSKMFVAAAAMTLVDDGALDLDAPVTGVVPFLQLTAPGDASGITTAQLLHHTSGLPDGYQDECDTDDAALERFFRAQPPMTAWAAPGRVWNYSNVGYDLAGLVVERAADSRFRCAMRDRLFGPAGMVGMTYDPDVALAREHAVGRSTGAAGAVDITPADMRCAVDAPAGILWGTVVDLGHFTEMLLAGGDGVLSAASAAAMMEGSADTLNPSPANSYGYGLFETQFFGERLVWHDGSNAGVSTVLMMLPERNAAVVVLLNGQGDATSPALRALEQMLGLTGTAFPDEAPDAATFARYVGTYEDPLELGQLVVTLEADKLYVTWEDGYKDELVPAGRQQFIIYVDGNYYLDFTIAEDAAGQGELLVSRAGVAHRVN